MKMTDILESNTPPHIDPRAVEVFREPEKILDHMQFWMEIQDGVTMIMRILPTPIPEQVPVLFDQLFKAAYEIAQFSQTPEDYAFSHNVDVQQKVKDLSDQTKEAIGYNVYKHFNSLVNDLNKSQNNLSKAVNQQPMTGYF